LVSEYRCKGEGINKSRNKNKGNKPRSVIYIGISQCQNTERGGYATFRIQTLRNKPLTEYKNGEIRHFQNTELEKYATVRIQNLRNMPWSEYRNGGIYHCKNTEMEDCPCQKTKMEEYATCQNT
jgi:hypothetical protein